MIKNKTLLLILLSFLSLSTFAFSAERLQVFTELEAPFNILSINDSWQKIDFVDDDESDDGDDGEGIVVEFELNEDDDVEFNLYSETLNAPLTLDIIQNQYQNYADGIANTIPLIDERAVEGFDYSILKVNPNLERQIINGIEWLKVSFTTKVTSSHSYYENETLIEETVEYSTYGYRNYFYVFQDHLYVMTFSGPLEKFGDYEELFNDTVSNLYSPE